MCSGSDNHSNAHLAHKTSPEPKVVGITEYLNVVGQHEGPCYGNKPCKEHKDN